MEIVIIFFIVFAVIIVVVIGLLVATLRSNSRNIQSVQKTKKAVDNKLVNELSTLVRPLMKDSTTIVALKSTEMPPNSNLKSHFGGLPYFEKGEKWPQSSGGERDGTCIASH